MFNDSQLYKQELFEFQKFYSGAFFNKFTVRLASFGFFSPIHSFPTKVSPIQRLLSVVFMYVNPLHHLSPSILFPL